MAKRIISVSILLVYFVMSSVEAQQVPPKASTETLAPVIERLVEAGRAALQHGDSAAAESAYKELLRIQPQNAEALYQLAIISFQRKDYVRGFELINKAVEISGDNPFPRLALAKATAEVGQIDQAIEQYEYVLAHTDPASRAADAAALELGLLKLRQASQKGDKDAVIKLGDQLIERYKNNQKVLDVIVTVYGKAGLLDEAIKVLERMQKNAPRDPSIEFRLAGVYELQRRPDLAVQHYEQAVEKGRGTVFEKSGKIRLKLIEGFGDLQKGDRVAANEAFKSVVQLDENNIVANMNVAIFAQENNDFKAAEESYRRVLKVQPDNMDAHLRLAAISLDRGDVFTGVRELDYILARAPNSRFAQAAGQMMGRIAQRWKIDVVRKTNADEDRLRQTLESNPQDSVSLMKLADILLLQHHNDEAKELLERAISADPNNGEAYYKLGLLHEEAKEYENAVSEYQSAMALVSDEETMKSLELRLFVASGNLYLKNKDFKKAEDSFTRANEMSPNDLAIMWGLATANSQQGNLETALAWYQKIIDLKPDHVGARMNAAFIYQQLEEEEQAIANYHAVALLKNVPEEIKKGAEARADYLQRQINGFSYIVGYGISFDDNLNSARDNRYFEYRSDLYAGVNYRYKLKKGLKFSLNVTPNYSIYHRAQFDFLNFTVAPSLLFSKGGYDWNLGLSRNNQSSVLRPEQSETITDTLNGGVNWVTKEKVGYRVFMSYRGFGSTLNPFFDANTLNLGISVNESKPDNVIMSYGYAITINSNKNSLGNDYAYVGHGLNGRLDKRINEKLSLNLSGNIRLNLYTNGDSSTGFKRHRRTFGFSVGTGLNYRMDEWVSFVADYRYSLQYSNLPAGLIFNELQAVEGRQSSTLGGFTRSTINAGIRMNF
jgi:pentatricopeptide repeat protein